MSNIGRYVFPVFVNDLKNFDNYGVNRIHCENPLINLKTIQYAVSGDFEPVYVKSLYKLGLVLLVNDMGLYEKDFSMNVEGYLLHGNVMVTKQEGEELRALTLEEENSFVRLMEHLTRTNQCNVDTKIIKGGFHEYKLNFDMESKTNE